MSLSRVYTDPPQGVVMSGARDVISGDRLTLTCRSVMSNPESRITWYDARGRQMTHSVTSQVTYTQVWI